MKYKIIIVDKFDSAHFLPNYDGKCANMHGHTWRVQVEFAFDALMPNGMAIDFVEAKRQVKEMTDKLDHHLINSISGLENPTAEIIAEWLCKNLQAHNVTVWESDKAAVTYYNEN